MNVINESKLIRNNLCLIVNVLKLKYTHIVDSLAIYVTRVIEKRKLRTLKMCLWELYLRAEKLIFKQNRIVSDRFYFIILNT